MISAVKTNLLAWYTRRIKRRAAIYLVALIWAVVLYEVFAVYFWTEQDSYSDLAFDGSIDKTPALQDKAAFQKVKETILEDLAIQMYQRQNKIIDSRRALAHSSVYDVIFANHNVNSVLGSLDMAQRCDLYFTTLYTQEHNWYLNPKADLPLDHRDSFRYSDFRNRNKDDLVRKLAKERGVDEKEIETDDEFYRLLKIEYDQFWASTLKVEQSVVDMLAHLRIFNKCYVTRDNSDESSKLSAFIKAQKKFIGTLSLLYTDTEIYDPESLSVEGIDEDVARAAAAAGAAADVDKKKAASGGLEFVPTRKEKMLNTDSFHGCANLESRIYPWLSFLYPIYERWNNEIRHSPPNLRKYNLPACVFEPSNKAAHGLKGKGFKVKSKLTNNNQNCFLPSFKNKLNGKGIVLSISDSHIDETVRLIHLLRALDNKYPIQIVYNDGLSEANKNRLRVAAREVFATLPSSFEDVREYFPKEYLDSRLGLPRQELWFVNVNRVIQNEYKDKFGGYGNKFLATMFNSFEEFMLLDADSVLVQNPDYFFKLKNYVSKGAYFYKDRSAPQFRPDSDCAFFEKITPSVLDQIVFDIPAILPDSFKNPFFQGMFYYMESGLVMINRNMHFNAVTMMIQMNFLKTVTGRVYGDKEIFFLAFLAAGEENFHFNKFFAAAIGQVSPYEERFEENGLRPKVSKEICAAHPAHVDGEDGKSLVWFNSGFKFCGQSESVNYENEFGEGRRYKHLKDVEEMKKLFRGPIRITHAIVPPFKSKLKTWADNEQGEPKQAWKWDISYCNRYLWCAYDRIGGVMKNGEDTTQLGTFIEFDYKSVQLFNYYGDVWVGNE